MNILQRETEEGENLIISLVIYSSIIAFMSVILFGFYMDTKEFRFLSAWIASVLFFIIYIHHLCSNTLYIPISPWLVRTYGFVAFGLVATYLFAIDFMLFDVIPEFNLESPRTRYIILSLISAVTWMIGSFVVKRFVALRRFGKPIDASKINTPIAIVMTTFFSFITYLALFVFTLFAVVLFGLK